MREVLRPRLEFPVREIIGSCRSGWVDLVVINDVELAVFVFPEDLDEVIDERVMIINDKYIFYF